MPRCLPEVTRAEPTRTATARRSTVFVGLLALVVAVVLATSGQGLLEPSGSTAGSVLDHRAPATSTAPAAGLADAPLGAPGDVPPAAGEGLGLADGAVPDATTVFDDHVPGVANLDPALLTALRRAAKAASRDGVTFVVNSGWRSEAYQRRLLDDAVAEHGSREEAARWVATPSTSAHVSGDAVDLGTEAAGWLAEHGSAYGLCQIYRNEPWHFELRPAAVDDGCPDRYDDPTDDPRMR